MLPSPIIVYLMLAAFSTLIFIPIMPFAHKLPQTLNIIVAGVVVIILAVSWVTFPFTLRSPFRVYFQQSVEVAPATPGLSTNGVNVNHTVLSEVVRAETTVTGLPGYIDRYIVPEIPSSRLARISCDLKGMRPDLLTCAWDTDMIPSPGGNSSLASARSTWLDVRTARLNATRALVSVRGANTRGCRLYFDRPITFLYVHPPSSGDPDTPSHAPSPVPYEKMRMQGGYEMPAAGVKEARLWSRTWDRTFLVEVGWEQDVHTSSSEESQGLSGRAACEYAEYASALAGPGSGLIPAFEEVKEFLPLWALPSKLADGLAEVWTKFSV